MKKGIVVLLLVLALVVMVSPGLVGKLAEESMDNNLEWAATETREIDVTSLGFDRRWFSSEGQHRIELLDGEIRAEIQNIFDHDVVIPALIIDTHIDHGLVPMASMGHEKGSLMPGLGRATSTFRIERPDGSMADIPGTVYSSVGLTGSLNSNLVMEPGSFNAGGEWAHWGDIDIEISARPASNRVIVRGHVTSLDLVNDGTARQYGQIEEVRVGPMSFSADQRMTDYDLSVGEASFDIESVTIPAAWGPDELGPLTLTTTTALDGDKLSGTSVIDFRNMPFSNFGRANFFFDASMAGVDARAITNLGRALDSDTAVLGGPTFMKTIEGDLLHLLADGFEFRFDRFDIEMQQGTLQSKLDVRISPTDLDEFQWAPALMAVHATLDVRVPAELMDALVAMDPMYNASIGMGFLRKNGNVYEMHATFVGSALEVNGAPVPVPLPGGN